MFVICKKFHHKGSLVRINSIKWLIITDDRIIHFVPSLENSKCSWVNVWSSLQQIRQLFLQFCRQPTVYLLVNYWLSTSFIIFFFFFNFLPAGRCWKPSQCSHKVPVDFVFALATLPNKTSVNLNLIENFGLSSQMVDNAIHLINLYPVDRTEWMFCQYLLAEWQFCLNIVMCTLNNWT